MKVLIVDDHELVSESLTFALTQAGYAVVASIKDASLSELFVEKFHPDIIIMDVLTLNNSDGILATQRIKEKNPKIRVMILTGFDEIEYIKRAKAAKADSFIYKTRPMNEIIMEVKETLMGRGKYPSALEREEPSIYLTNKELEILSLICEGLSRKEIAERLFLSDNTIKTHIAHLYEKTGCNSKSQLCIYALSNGIIKK